MCTTKCDSEVSSVKDMEVVRPFTSLCSYKWKNHLFKMKGDNYRDELELQKGKNKELLLSRTTQNYMTHPYIFVVDSDANSRQRYRDGVM